MEDKPLKNEHEIIAPININFAKEKPQEATLDKLTP